MVDIFIPRSNRLTQNSQTCRFNRDHKFYAQECLETTFEKAESQFAIIMIIYKRDFSLYKQTLSSSKLKKNIKKNHIIHLFENNPIIPANETSVSSCNFLPNQSDLIAAEIYLLFSY